MVKAANNDADLLAFTERLKARVIEYLERAGIRRGQLAELMGVYHSQVSVNLSDKHVMNEAFVQRLSSLLPEFSDAHIRYFEIKNGLAPTQVTAEASERARERAEAQAQIIEAAEEVQRAAARLTEIILRTYRP